MSQYNCLGLLVCDFGSLCVNLSTLSLLTPNLLGGQESFFPLFPLHQTSQIQKEETHQMMTREKPH